MSEGLPKKPAPQIIVGRLWAERKREAADETSAAAPPLLFTCDTHKITHTHTHRTSSCLRPETEEPREEWLDGQTDGWIVEEKTG